MYKSRGIRRCQEGRVEAFEFGQSNCKCRVLVGNRRSRSGRENMAMSRENRQSRENRESREQEKEV